MSKSQTIERSTDNFWDKRAERYEQSISSHDQQYDQRMAHLRSLIQPTDQLLDFGCASGEIALDLAANVKSIDAIDLSKEMISLAKTKAAQRNIQNACFLHASISEERLEAESYDVVLGLNVLHLIRERRETLQRIYALLKPGGRLLLEIPCLAEFSWFKRTAIGAASGIGWAPYVYAYSFGEAEEELKSLGFEVLGTNNSTQPEPRASIAAIKPTE